MKRTRVWDVTWGRAVADVVIAGGYVDITNGRVGDRPDSFITPNGRYALGFRKDNAEEIAAHVRLTNWPVVDLRHAFQLDDWPMDGTATCVDAGPDRPLQGACSGPAAMRIERGKAWDERFDWATADLALEGTGMSINEHRMCKRDGVATCRGPGIDRAAGDGDIQGQAHVGWEGTYSFQARGEGVPVEHLDNFHLETAPLSGRLSSMPEGKGRSSRPSTSSRARFPTCMPLTKALARLPAA